MRPRFFMLLVAFGVSTSLFAQSNALALFANHGTFNNTSASDPTGVTLEIRFDSKTGYGASYDRFVSPNLSAQFLAQRIRGSAKLVISAPGSSLSQEIGSLDLDQYDAALHWHFGSPSSRIRPYVGGGIAAIQNAKITVNPDFSESGTKETTKLDNKITWVADAGLDIRVTPNASIIVTAKYTPYSGGVGAAAGDPVESLKLDPLTYAAGIQWRF